MGMKLFSLVLFVLALPLILLGALAHLTLYSLGAGWYLSQSLVDYLDKKEK